MRSRGKEARKHDLMSYRHLWTTRAKEHVLVERGRPGGATIEHVIWDTKLGRPVDVEPVAAHDFVIKRMLMAGVQIVTNPPAPPPVCPVCGSFLEMKGLLLMARRDDDGTERVCQACWECPTDAGRYWCWADRDHSTVQPWPDDRWPFEDPAEVAGGLSALGPRFLSMLSSELRSRGEVLLLHRRTHAGGAKDWYLISDAEDASEILKRGRQRDMFQAFPGHLFSQRGALDAGLQERMLSDGRTTAELVVAQQPAGAGALAPLRVFEPDDEDELRETLLDWAGTTVVAGAWPSDQDEIARGYIPDLDGRLRPGVY